MEERILKPCPFCGRNVRICVDGYYGAPVITHDQRSRVDCVMERRVFWGESVEGVVKKWNMRADSRTEDDGK